MDYYTWVVIGPAGAFVIDTGFTAEMAKARKREFLRCPIESLKLIGIEAGSVRDVVLTHMHYDHVGNFDKFPNARFHLQEREMAYATAVMHLHPALEVEAHHADYVLHMIAVADPWVAHVLAACFTQRCSGEPGAPWSGFSL